jgi:peptidase E
MEIMPGQMIILQGGEDLNRRTNAFLFRKLAEISTTKNILVIGWTTDSAESEAKYRNVFRQYFSESGFSGVIFLDRNDDEKTIHRKLSTVDVLYLAGGDPDILIRDLDAKSIYPLMKNFKGTIIGNSAGAIVISKGMFLKDRLYRGYGMVDFFVTVHYRLGTDESYPGKNTPETLNIPEDMWICVYR